MNLLSVFAATKPGTIRESKNRKTASVVRSSIETASTEARQLLDLSQQLWQLSELVSAIPISMDTYIQKLPEVYSTLKPSPWGAILDMAVIILEGLQHKRSIDWTWNMVQRREDLRWVGKPHHYPEQKDLYSPVLFEYLWRSLAQLVTPEAPLNFEWKTADILREALEGNRSLLLTPKDLYALVNERAGFRTPSDPKHFKGANLTDTYFADALERVKKTLTP